MKTLLQKLWRALRLREGPDVFSSLAASPCATPASLEWFAQSF